ncbi:tRNA lysidine(34) synthetase TilS [Methylosinus sp. Sm6]|uniref:tRNA lysidine(34) synthetase TilS n=1 Tax=Methylosinus sp. Sm6 TaxID=2866948 RepID=UPI001C99CDB1|nr:tRNA lysidine(34) synthetase TilS [Methylosinus sp. Sm6]MBY6240528.1 tRNA lysidine(34) synthetase TilS [Methylosinus sp. Sm6]
MPADVPDPDRVLAPLAGHEQLLLAVSGGPDSMALMLLAARWSLRETKRIAVATVDHGLRAEAAEEAALVGEWAQALGLPHHILRWEGEKPRTRIQERARTARYRLLAECARATGATAIVTAHHADDQAETILFRLARGSGIAGLAGMAPASRLDGLALLRPLLGLRKQALEALCEAAGQPFFRDPSNENPAYARARLRRLSTLLEQQGLSVDALLRLGARAARAEEALADAARAAAAALPAERGEGLFRVAAAPVAALPRELLRRVVAAEIERIGGSTARLERQERACDRLHEALAAGLSFKATLGGAEIALTTDTLTIRPEPPRRQGAARRP